MDPAHIAEIVRSILSSELPQQRRTSATGTTTTYVDPSIAINTSVQLIEQDRLQHGIVTDINASGWYEIAVNGTKKQSPTRSTSARDSTSPTPTSFNLFMALCPTDRACRITEDRLTCPRHFVRHNTSETTRRRHPVHAMCITSRQFSRVAYHLARTLSNSRRAGAQRCTNQR